MKKPRSESHWVNLCLTYVEIVIFQIVILCRDSYQPSMIWLLRPIRTVYLSKGNDVVKPNN
jgi:hypothetical protein